MVIIGFLLFAVGVGVWIGQNSPPDFLAFYIVTAAVAFCVLVVLEYGEG